MREHHLRERLDVVGQRVVAPSDQCERLRGPQQEEARALLHGRDHALPDDVQELASVVLAHRIMLVPEAAGVGRSEIVADAIASTPAL